jgi:phosphorylcholine metabolism protein LicD
VKQLFFVFLIFFISRTFAQTEIPYEELPDPIKRFFPVVYTVDESVDVNWQLKDSLYVACFISNEYPVEVQFKANGFWVITYWDIDCKWVPGVITSKMEEEFKNYAHDRCRISNNAFDEKYYQITLIPSDGNLPPQIVVFTSDGKMILP